MTEDNQLVEAPVQSYGVKETIEVIDLGLDVLLGVKKSLPGGLTFLDAVNFIPVVKDAPAAFKDANLIPKELSELSGDELIQIEEHVKARIPELELQEHVQRIVQKSFALGLALVDLGGEFVGQPAQA